MRRRNKIALGTLLGLLALVAAGAGLAYYYAATLAERNAVAFLAQRGIEVTSLKVKRLDFAGAELSAVDVRRPVKAGVEDATLNFRTRQFNFAGAYLTPSPDQRFTADLSGKYTLDLEGDTLSAEGALKGTSDPFTATFALKQDFAGATGLDLRDALLQWGGGSVGVARLSLAFPVSKNIGFTLQVRGVSLDALLKKALGEASAEGTVSGDVPMVLRPDGSFVFGAGTLTASKGGVIRIPPGTFPVQNEQLAAVSGILSDFHYTTLSIQLVPGEKDALTVLLKLEGSNPNAYNGREVKLNINLGGDVLHFVQSSLLPLNDPSRWLTEQK